MRYDIVLLILASVLIFISTVNGDISNNTSSIYNDTYNTTSYNNSSNKTPETYKVLVDGYYGFYRVYNLSTGEEISGEEYDNNTLYIHVGDIIVWSNEDLSESFTIASEPKLWSDRKGYLTSGKKFSYTFNQSGMYDIYIRQIKMPNQTVIVESSLNRTTRADSAINKTIIFKKNSQSVNSTESEIKIKIYRKHKETSGFEVMVTIPVIIMIYVLRQKKEEGKKR